MKLIWALVALIMAACAWSMPGTAADEGYWKNSLFIPATEKTGRITFDVTLTGNDSVLIRPNKYPSKVVYNPATGVVANYDGINAVVGARVRPGDIAYDANAEELVFNDNSTVAGAVQLFYYKNGAPSVEVFIAAVNASLKTLKDDTVFAFYDDSYVGYPAKTWEIINPLTLGVRGCSGFARISDNAIIVFTADEKSYDQLKKRTFLGGL
jgi:hypothetical protein